MMRMRRLRSLRRLSAREALVAIQLVIAAGILEIALHQVRFPRLVAWIRANAPGAGARFPLGRAALRPGRTEQLASAAASLWRGKESCLRRSLLTLWIMLGESQDARLVIGVPKASGAPFRAHAWIERNAVPYRESAGQLSELTVLARY